jgi:hypothetical protein
MEQLKRSAMLWEPTRFKVGRRPELDFYLHDPESDR